MDPDAGRGGRLRPPRGSASSPGTGSRENGCSGWPSAARHGEDQTAVDPARSTAASHWQGWRLPVSDLIGITGSAAAAPSPIPASTRRCLTLVTSTQAPRSASSPRAVAVPSRSALPYAMAVAVLGTPDRPRSPSVSGLRPKSSARGTLSHRITSGAAPAAAGRGGSRPIQPHPLMIRSD